MSSASDSFCERSRFAILEHDHPFLHWDLLLQYEQILHAWRLLQPVICNQWIPAEALPDHRLLYLDYEGPVSGDRGCVYRIAEGRFQADGPASNSDQSFRLFDCDLATRAFQHCDDAGRLGWYFTVDNSSPTEPPSRF